MKHLIKKAITSSLKLHPNYNLIIMMKNMTEAFHNVNRKILLGKLETILDESEIRMMYLLINNIKLKVRVGRSLV